MALNLLDIQPTTVSKDLSSYIIYLYGDAKVGKTTFCRDAGALILATEKGYAALSGAFVMDINKWSDIKAVVRELKKPEIKEKFKVIAVDIVDVAAKLCEKYVCNNNGVDALGKIPYGGGWSQFKDEFSNTFREISMLGYSIIFISHVKEINDSDGNLIKIKQAPTTTTNEIIRKMCDIITYAYLDPETGERKLVTRSNDGVVDAGSRFPYLEPVIDFSYKSLQDAIVKAIDKQAEVEGYVTEERHEVEEAPKLDYQTLMNDFQDVVTQLLSEDANNSVKITEVVERTLGTGKKFTECSSRQVEAMSIIIDDLKELLASE
jgi:hypothetical protein